MAAGPALGHEFWIEPEDFTPDSGAPVVAQLKNGQEFLGNTLSYFGPRITRFDMIRGDEVIAVEGRAGDIPALSADAPGDGLWSIVHETAPQRLTYAEWAKFAAFAEHKDFPDILARHTARGLPRDGFAETYTRHVKALVGVGDGAGRDVEAGLATEFVALANPYTDALPDGLPVRLMYGGAPRGDAQVEIFDRGPDGQVTITTTRTDARGEARIPVRAGHDYLLDAVVLRPAPDDHPAVWESLWAALTFAVPATGG